MAQRTHNEPMGVLFLQQACIMYNTNGPGIGMGTSLILTEPHKSSARPAIMVFSTLSASTTRNKYQSSHRFGLSYNHECSGSTRGHALGILPSILRSTRANLRVLQHATRGPEMVAINCVLLALATVIVALRFYTR
jgi:hypothetical protein